MPSSPCAPPLDDAADEGSGVARPDPGALDVERLVFGGREPGPMCGIGWAFAIMSGMDMVPGEAFTEKLNCPGPAPGIEC